jgi:2-polyprenyl-3-methyl-5-hydroxy-6-metoxy-1,4-benzoquinol methylase
MENSTMTDPIFSNPRLANIYDAFDPDRSDIEPYVELIKSLGVKKVVDLGCGTGVLALTLSGEGFNVAGVDPAQASIDAAKAKPGADNVNWVAGDATILHSNSAELVVMTGNVAQAIINPQDWASTLRHVNDSLKSGGYFIFETRKPEAKAWEDWNKEKTFQSIEVASVGLVDGWAAITRIDLPLVSFQWSYYFHKDKETITSDSTLRFRDQEEVTLDLKNNGFKVIEVREAPDRPGKEFVFIAQVVK